MYGASGMGYVCLHISLACWGASDLFVMFVEAVKKFKLILKQNNSIHCYITNMSC